MIPLFIPVPISFATRSSIVYPRYYQYQPHQNTVMVGNLPDDFLRISVLPTSSQEEQDRATAIHLQNQIIAQSNQPTVKRLEILLVNAVLNKNYGISRMDPYVRLRIGHQIYETHTAPNGAKNPSWNKTFQIYNFPRGVNQIHVEIFDERTLTDDELIAWAQVPIPECVFQGEVVDEWYQLSGKLGDGMEGVVHMVMSFANGPAPIQPPVMMLQGYGINYPQVPIYTMPPPHSSYAMGAPESPARPTSPTVKEEDIKQLSEMFPSIEEETVKLVLEASNANKEAAINSLLQMQ